MSNEVFIAILSLVGTLVGSLSGILVANKLVNFRLEKLEKKVDLHNNAVERLYVAEGQITELQHEMIYIKHNKMK